MRSAQQRRNGVWLAAIAAAVALFAPTSAVAADQPAKGWEPPPPIPDKFDWIQLTSLEWLKGELIAMYDDELEFDSDELEELTFEWEDIRQIRTARLVRVAFLDGSVALGKLLMDDNKVRVIDKQVYESTRSQVLSITSGAVRRLDLWSGKLSAGLNNRTGNTSQTEANASASLMRRTPRDRINLQLLGNFSETDGTGALVQNSVGSVRRARRALRRSGSSFGSQSGKKP